ncbi:C40 family peptidase [Kitasatospora kifunensis]|uniref:Cell wall-associated NlpC family hydrolase n=1 Tax=Kitasatospora kifunensis TaxID=58351 RepID=A0A7W7R833_KITKI|nr:NlpC/P60 family protein [Kitasatospora kifunensis]MBB4927111.1 cell wall-associated NlpC family hydrolase [Kitasatospora kifunensis]
MSSMRKAKIGSAAATLAALLLFLTGPSPSSWAAASHDRAGPATDCAVLAPGASATAESAVRAACEQIGVWYSWGGGHGPTPGATYGHPDGVDPASNDDGQRLGFDCSGLVRYAYAQATGQDLLNGDAGQQFYTLHAAQRFTADQGTAPLLPGDLLAYGSSDNLHHIAIYLGADQMVEARQSGTHIMVSPVRLGGDYFGAVRIAPGPVTGITAQTWGTGVWTHAQPSTDSPRIYAFADSTTVRVACQEHAQSVTAEGVTNDAWSFLPDYQAWLSNIYLQGPAWLDSVPTC